MIRGVLADTGPLYAANDKDDIHHRRALRQLNELAYDKQPVLVAYPILLEAYSLLLLRLGGRSTLDWLSEMGASSFVNPEPEDYHRATLTVRMFSDQGISLVDATLAALATRLGLQVWTYDHHFDVMRVPIWR
jgi:predicted nucleic acid-binding protein